MGRERSVKVKHKTKSVKINEQKETKREDLKNLKNIDTILSLLYL